MVPQLLPTLVSLVVRQPECLRISDVNRDRHAEFAAALPNRVESRVVYPDELACAIAKIKPQPLVFLEAGGAEPVPFLDLSDCAL